MPNIKNKQRTSMLRVAAEVVETRVDNESPISNNPGPLYHIAWQGFIQRLKDWLADPTQLDDEGVDAPAPTIIRLALDYAEVCRDKGLVSPYSVLVDADGGIVFRRSDEGVREDIHFWKNGELEYILYVDGDLVDRRPFDYVC